MSRFHSYAESKPKMMLMVVVIIKTTIIQGDGLGESVVNIYTYIKRDLRVRERGSIRKSIKYYLESRDNIDSL
jgi:hypothetical protein